MMSSPCNMVIIHITFITTTTTWSSSTTPSSSPPPPWSWVHDANPPIDEAANAGDSKSSDESGEETRYHSGCNLRFKFSDDQPLFVLGKWTTNSQMLHPYRHKQFHFHFISWETFLFKFKTHQALWTVGSRLWKEQKIKRTNSNRISEHQTALLNIIKKLSFKKFTHWLIWWFVPNFYPVLVLPMENHPHLQLLQQAWVSKVQKFSKPGVQKFILWKLFFHRKDWSYPVSKNFLTTEKKNSKEEEGRSCVLPSVAAML